MELNWTHIWHTMSPLAKMVALCLIIMGLMSLSVFIDRCFVLFRHQRKSKEFIRKLEPILNNPNFEAALNLASKFQASYAARLVSMEIRHYLAHKRPERVAKRLGQYVENISQEMRQGFGILSTVGSVAPFVGLLGTVIGIISAFEGIAKTGSGGLAAVSAGIAEALVETALGLFVAIPAVIAFHYLSGKIEKEEIFLKNIAQEIVDKMEDKSAKEVP